MYMFSTMKQLPTLAALAFGIPVLLVFVIAALLPPGYYYLLAGPVCGIVGGLVFGRRLGFSLVLGSCFGIVGFMFSLQDVHSTLFSEVIWTGLLTGFLFWVAGGCAVLTLPVESRFNGAAALFIPGVLAGATFQFFYGPGRFLFDLASQQWWTGSPWEHLLLWLVAGAGGGFFMGRKFQRQLSESKDDAKYYRKNSWAIAGIVCGGVGLLTAAFYFLRSSLPLGLFNSLSPATIAADWLWGWGILAAAVAGIAAFMPHRRLWTACGIGLAAVLVLASYRVEAQPWKSRFNSNYAEKLLRDNAGSGDAVYTGNLILAQAALDTNDIAKAKERLLEAATTSGAKRIEQSGLDTSVVRVLYDKGEKDAVLEYLQRGKQLWPQGAQTISRWEAAIKAGRRPNFNPRGGGPGGQGGGQAGQGGPGQSGQSGQSGQGGYSQ
jgi:hypothetical protein